MLLKCLVHTRRALFQYYYQLSLGAGFRSSLQPSWSPLIFFFFFWLRNFIIPVPKWLLFLNVWSGFHCLRSFFFFLFSFKIAQYCHRLQASLRLPHGKCHERHASHHPSQQQRCIWQGTAINSGIICWPTCDLDSKLSKSLRKPICTNHGWKWLQERVRSRLEYVNIY